MAHCVYVWRIFDKRKSERDEAAVVCVVASRRPAGQSRMLICARDLTGPSG